MDNKKIGELIARLRKEKGLTQRELGEKVHVGSRAVSKWECGVTIPDISIINELSEILGISSTELLSGETLTKPQITKPKKKISTKTKLLLIFIPILITIIAITLLIHFNNKTYLYGMNAVNYEQIKVDGYVTYKRGSIEMYINKIKFNEFEKTIFKLKDYQYYIKLGDETIVGYGQTKEDNSIYKNHTISDLEEILKINYNGTTELTSKKLLKEKIYFNLTLWDIDNNEYNYQYEISLYKKTK